MPNKCEECKHFLKELESNIWHYVCIKRPSVMNLNSFPFKDTNCKDFSLKNRIIQAFRWRDRKGNFFLPSEMQTRHLFYTLRMIWNHTMPLDAQFKHFKKYEFSKFYTEDYLKSAVYYITNELAVRDDIKPAWEKELQTMINYLLKYPLNIEKKLHGIIYQPTE